MPHKNVKKLRQIIQDKQTNLALSADVCSKSELLELAKQVGPHICVLKTHMDIVKDFDMDLVLRLKQLANQEGFLIMEDRKFADIGHIVAQQCMGGLYRIATWAHFVTAYVFVGPGMLKALKQVIGQYPDLALLLLCQLSAKDNLLDEHYQKKSLEWAVPYAEMIAGFVGQKPIRTGIPWLWLTPGVHLKDAGDDLGQVYRSPKSVDSDVLIVGRGIYQTDSPQRAAQRYKELTWSTFCKRRQMH